MTMRASACLAAAALLAFAGACRKGPENLQLGAACGSDPECSSGICLFQKHGSETGKCTRECDLENDDCPEGTACATIADHAGKSVPVCGEPPPLPLGNMPGAMPTPQNPANRSRPSQDGGGETQPGVPGR